MLLNLGLRSLALLQAMACGTECLNDSLVQQDRVIEQATALARANLDSVLRSSMDSSTLLWVRYRALECGLLDGANRQDSALHCRVQVNDNRLRALAMLNPDSNFASTSATTSICPDAETTVAIRQCADSVLLATRELLRQAAVDARRMLPSSQRASFDSASQVWSDYTKRFCGLVSALLEGGTMAPFVNQTCLRAFYDERTALLATRTKRRRS